MPAETDGDEAVMALVARGQSHKLEALIRRHATSLFGFIRRLVGDRHRSEELFQEVFLTVWTKRSQYTFPRSFKNWLYAIALNKCRALFRDRSRGQVSLNGHDVMANADISPIDAVLADETADTVGRALLTLPTQQRAVVTLRIWENMPYARIATIVDCSEATARSHMHLGLRELRRVLQPQLGEQITPERK
jgi:RNA polymerase sigma-70 factor (ECF subfamily)